MRITIAIPTIAGRERYLRSCLQTCVAQDDASLQILVSDNSKGDARKVVESFHDDRIAYVQTAEYLPMSAHWSFLLEHVAGDMLCIIGDDDGLMKNCIPDVRSLVTRYGRLPITQPLCCFYWDDYLLLSRRRTVSFYHDCTGTPQLHGSTDYLQSVATGTKSYLDGPMVYHGFVPTELLKNPVGMPFFKRSSPDVYSAMAVACQIDAFVRSGSILTIPGQGAKANGAACTNRSPLAKQFEADMKAHYPPRFDVRAITMHEVDSLIEAASIYGQPQVESQIDYVRHLAISLNSARRIPGTSAKVQEAISLLRIASRKKRLLHLLFSGPQEVIKQRAARRSRLEHSTVAVHAGLTVNLDAVSEIHQAGPALATWLQNRDPEVFQELSAA